MNEDVQQFLFLIILCFSGGLLARFVGYDPVLLGLLSWIAVNQVRSNS